MELLQYDFSCEVGLGVLITIDVLWLAIERKLKLVL